MRGKRLRSLLLVFILLIPYLPISEALVLITRVREPTEINQNITESNDDEGQYINKSPVIESELILNKPTGSYNSPVDLLNRVLSPDTVYADSYTSIDNSTTITTEITDIYSDETTVITDMSVTYVGNIHSDAGVMRNLNSYSSLIPYKPTTKEIPTITDHILKVSGYSALYDGFYDLPIMDILNQAKQGGQNVVYDGVTAINRLVGKLEKSSAEISNFNSILGTTTKTTESSPEGNITNPRYELEALSGVTDGQSSIEYFDLQRESRESKILGDDITLIADSIVVTEYVAMSETNHGPGVELPLNPDRSGHLLMDSLKSNILGNNLPIIDSFLKRKYVVHQYFASDREVALRYQVIPMLYKAAEQYQYDIMAWNNSSMLNPNMDILMAEVPIVNVVDWVGATVKAGRFYSDVYVSRSNVSRYITKAVKDGLIPPYEEYDKINAVIINEKLPTPTKDDPKTLSVKTETPYRLPDVTLDYFNEELTKIEFFHLLKNFMVLNGEAEMNKTETSALLAAYGAAIPYALKDIEQDTIKYLLARGIIDPDLFIDYTDSITIAEVKTYLMRMKDKDSRLDFKKVMVPYNASLVDRGFAVNEISESNNSVEGMIVHSSVAPRPYRDILVRIQDETRFVNGKSMVTPVFTTDYETEVSLSGSNTIVDIKFMGVITGNDFNQYYHFRYNKSLAAEDESKTAARVAETATEVENEKYISINTVNSGETPYAISIPIDCLDGGIYKFTKKRSQGPPYANYTAADNRCSSYVAKSETDTFDSVFGINHSFLDSNMIENESSRITRRYLTSGTYCKYTFYIDSPLESYLWRESTLDSLWQSTLSLKSEDADAFAKDPFYKDGIKVGSAEIRVLFTDSKELKDDGFFNLNTDGKASIVGRVEIMVKGEIEDFERFVAYNLKTSKVKNGDGKIAQIAYVASVNSIMVPYTYLKEKGFLRGMSYREKSSSHGNIYIFYGPNTNIFVIENFMNTGITRAIYGNVVVDYDRGITNPLVVASDKQEEFLLDYRLIFGVTKDFLNLKSNTGAITPISPKKSSVDTRTLIRVGSTTKVDAMGNLVNESDAIQGTALEDLNFVNIDEVDPNAKQMLDNAEDGGSNTNPATVGDIDPTLEAPVPNYSSSTPPQFSALALKSGSIMQSMSGDTGVVKYERNFEVLPGVSPPNVSGGYTNEVLGYIYKAEIPTKGGGTKSATGGMLLMEATNYLSNYYIYQRRSNGLSRDFLVVLKPYDSDSMDIDKYDTSQWKVDIASTNPHDMSQAMLDRLGIGMKLADNEIASITEIDPSVQFDPSFVAPDTEIVLGERDETITPLGISQGPYGYQYSVLTVGDIEALNETDNIEFNLHKYLYGNPTKLPLSYVMELHYSGYSQAVSDVDKVYLTNLMFGNLTLNYKPVNGVSKGFEWVAENFSGKVHYTAKGRPFTLLNMSKDALTIYDDSADSVARLKGRFDGLEYFSFKREVPIGVISRYYMNPTANPNNTNDMYSLKEVYNNPRNILTYNGIQVSISKTQKGRGEEIVYNLRLGTSDNLIIREYSEKEFEDSDLKVFRKVFYDGKYNVFIFQGAASNYQMSHINPVEEDYTKTGISTKTKSHVDYNYDYDSWMDLLKLDAIEAISILLIIIVTEWIPIILEGMLLILALLSLVKDTPPVAWWCRNVFDIFKVLSLTLTNHLEIRPKRIWLVTFVASVIFGLIRNGILFDVFDWLMSAMLKILSLF